MHPICALLILIFSFIRLEANNIQVLKEGPIHESFVTQEFGNFILQVVPDQPPSDITEEPPQNKTSDAIWIPGYWHWLRDEGNYIWVSGVWRKPPPHHHWVKGNWMDYQFGWLWLKGYWSNKFESEIVYISEPPPDPLNESVPLPPSSADNYFWIPGYWEWESESQGYRWLSGRWSFIDEKMQYVPAQYYWREKGYFFIPGFWDWGLENRGTAFADISVDQEDRGAIVFEPSDVLDNLQIVEKLFPFWPNYPSFFRYHFLFYQKIWVSWDSFPPWWFWPTWWTFPVQDNWWLWWWWSHEGYPNPPWMTQEIADSIAPPNNLSLKIMKDIKSPPIVTANGVVGCKELIEAIIIATGKNDPVLSSDPKQVEQIQDLADPRVPTPPYLRPNGEKKLTNEPKKPSEDVDRSKMELTPGRVKRESGYYELPQQEYDPFASPENRSSAHPMHTPYYLKRTEQKNLTYNQTESPTPSAPDTPKPFETPEAQETPKAPKTPKAPNMVPHGHTPYYYSPNFRPPPYSPPPPPPSVPPPNQGYDPSIYYEYPQPQMQTQHLDEFMTRPQPQENPGGPKAHPLPGDESTLPYY